MKKYIVHLLILMTLLSANLYANVYKDIVTVKLKKDETKKIIVISGNSKKLFKFRWTLYANNGLVVFRSYDRIVAQNILYLNHKNQSFRVELTTRGADSYLVPYILVKFKEFDYETDTAEFQLFLSDKNSKVSLEYLQEK